ncbi:MFS transporter [Rhodobacteraceae bacterium RKSG542]|uniref:MFS transporter n=1 Tax=Pseudovibrio flavus TaxID=2529854 RepID=UPI0012BC84AE|nr:MFS transporter [Pseudovibrio flavus]MTI17517.1 MFS transporter [Pseudovibrio flavus]
MKSDTKAILSLQALVLILALDPFVAQILRNSTALIAVSLEREFSMNAKTIGSLASAFSLGACFSLLPGAALVSRFGPRFVFLCFGLLMALGTAAFSMADSLTELFLARFLMGVGSGPLSTAGLYVLQSGASDNKFRFLSSETSFVGRLGALFATAPLALLVVALTWRGAMFSLAVVCAIATFLAVIGAKGREPAADSVAQAHGWRFLLNGFLLSRMLAITTIVGVNGTILALWGAPWLHSEYAMSTHEQGIALGVMAIGYAGGSLFAAEIAQYLGTRTVPVFTIVAAFFLVAIAYFQVSEVLIFPALLILGLVLSPAMVLVTEMRSAVAPEQLVRTLAVSSLTFSLGMFALQALSGFVIDLYPRTASGQHPPEAFHTLFYVLAGILLLTAAMLIYRRELRIAREEETSDKQ